MTQRNYLVWRKLIVVALVGRLAEPLIWLACLGLGSFLPPIDGMPYMKFLCAGMMCSSVMNSASSEGLNGAFSRWRFRRTWEATLTAPMSPVDIVVGEWLWAAVKGAISGFIIMLVMIAFGLLVSRPQRSARSASSGSNAIAAAANHNEGWRRLLICRGDKSARRFAPSVDGVIMATFLLEAVHLVIAPEV